MKIEEEKGVGKLQQYLPFTVLKLLVHYLIQELDQMVATVLTVYGIETLKDFLYIKQILSQLQQYLPFTVLKL